MRYMFNDKLKVAYTKSDELCKKLNYKDERMISTQEIIETAKQNYCRKIDIGYASFFSLGIKRPYGAMLKAKVDNNQNPFEAHIILNSDVDARFQRFSLLHEIGHLVTRAWNFDADTSNDFVVSTHIDYKITSLSEEEYENNFYLTNEQIANIFALRVLMPNEQFFKKIMDYNNIGEVAQFFGLTEDAVLSRMMIGA